MLFDFLLPESRGKADPQAGPTKVGLLVYADGVTFDPGGGAGYYWWDGTKYNSISPKHFGTMYADNIALTINIITVDVLVQIPSGLSGGEQRGCVFQNAREIKITRAGQYLVVYSVSGQTASVANKEMESEIMINGAGQPRGSSHALVSPGGSVRPETASGSSVFTLAVNDLVSLGILNHNDATDIVVEHVSMSVVEL